MKKIAIVSAVAAALVYAASLFTSPVPTSAQPGVRTTQQSVVTVSDEAIVSATPDRALIEIAVVNRAATARVAATENATRTERVLAAIRGAVKGHAKIETAQYGLTPNYDYPRESNGRPRLTGYTASNTVRVTSDDLGDVGPAIDAAVADGANNVQNLQFTLRDRHAAETRALRDAAERARMKADALASALGLKVVRVLEVVENGPVVRPFVGRMMAVEANMAQAASTPIQPGDVDVRAQVSMTVEVGR